MADAADAGEYRLLVRFPGDLGHKLRELAQVNRRSINNEILFRVERGLAAEKTAPAPTA